MANKTVTSPRGFLAAGIACGVKKSGKQDLGLIVCPAVATAAGVFTTNRIVSAAVTICKKHIKSRNISAVVVNSGSEVPIATKVSPMIASEKPKLRAITTAA